MKNQERIGSCRRGNTGRYGCTDSHVAQTPEDESDLYVTPPMWTATFELPSMVWHGQAFTETRSALRGATSQVCRGASVKPFAV